MKALIKSNNRILTIQNNELVQVPNATQQSFETYGMDNLTGLLATPSHRAIYSMTLNRLEGEGKVFSQKVNPEKWQRLIQNMRVS